MGYVVRIHADAPLPAYSEPRMRGPGQLELVIFNATLAPNLQRDEPVGPVQAYTVQSRRGHLYFTFQLDSPAVEADAYRDRATDDVLLGLTYGAGQRPPVRAVASRTPVASRAPAARARRTPVVTSDIGAIGDARQRWKLDTIVIDAGHGGHDKGAVGYGGVLEKDVNLAVSRRVGRMLEEQLGVNVVYTREDDRFITLRDRGKMANQAGAKLFVSIHSNAATNSTAHGTETYFLGTHKSEAARGVMERENSVVQLEANPDAYANMDKQALILQTLAQSAYLRSSEELAGHVEEAFQASLGRKSRGVKQAGFYVLWGASMPAILIELGFVTNPDEAALLSSTEGQDALAEAIFSAIRAYKLQYERGLDYIQAD